MNRHGLIRMIVCCLAGVLLLSTGRAMGKEENSSSPFSVWSQSIEASLKADSQTIEDIKILKTDADDLGIQMTAELNSYKIQEPIFSNQLASPTVLLKTLEESYLNMIESLRVIATRVSELKTKQEEIQKTLFQINDLSAIVNGQIHDVPSEVMEKPGAKTLISKLKKLAASLAAKKDIIQSVLNTYEALFSEINNISARYNILIKQFEQTIETKKNQELLERKKLFESLGLQKITADILELVEKSGAVLTRDFWAGQFRFVDSSEKLFLGSFLLVFMIVMVLVFRVRVTLDKLMNLPVLSEKYWTRIIMLLLKRSFPLIGAALFFYVIIQAQRFQPKPAILEAIVNVLLVWLFSKWFMDALKLLNTDAQLILPDNQLFWIRMQIQYHPGFRRLLYRYRLALYR